MTFSAKIRLPSDTFSKRVQAVNSLQSGGLDSYLWKYWVIRSHSQNDCHFQTLGTKLQLH